MQTIEYIQYFFYLVSKWDIQIAWHIIQQETRGERKYGIHTTGVDELRAMEEKGIDTSHSTNYMPATYDLLEIFFAEIKKYGLKNFLDIGSGKGRVLCVAAHEGFKQVTGIDFSKELCDEAKKNLEATRKKIPELSYRIINNDAFYYDIPPEVDCIFLFHPFDKVIMRGVIDNINASLVEFPRDLYIIYFNPVHLLQLTDNGFDEIFHFKKLRYLDGSILKKR